MRVQGIIDDNPDWFPWGDDNKRKSAGFVLLCMSTALEEPLEDCIDLLTEGGNDAGVDGLHVSDIEDGEFQITIFQGKYRVSDLDGEANFPANSVQKAVDTVGILFDPYREVALNEKIEPFIQEIRSLIRDGYVPNVQVVLCNNGARWQPPADGWIDEAQRRFGTQVQFLHFNHDAVVQRLKKAEEIDASIALSGQAIVENMNYMRMMVGRVAIHQLADIFEKHGDQLLQRNIRRHLGHANRINQDIRETLLDKTRSDKFYFYNNGVTMVCDRFNYNALQNLDYKVRLKNVQIVNGGQTCKTIQQTLSDAGPDCGDSAYVMVRIYELPEDSTTPDVVREITKATNSQTPVDLRDLRSNDEIQRTLALGMEGLGFAYKRHRDDSHASGNVLTSATVAEAVLAVWRDRPHQAKFRRRELFGKFYDLIFDGLNAAQAVLAALIFKGVEDRRRAGVGDVPDFLPYASHHLAMLIGWELLGDEGIAAGNISHTNFAKLKATLTGDDDRYYALAIDTLAGALASCYGNRDVSLQQLAATFRRGDLLEMLSPGTSMG